MDVFLLIKMFQVIQILSFLTGKLNSQNLNLKKNKQFLKIQQV